MEAAEKEHISFGTQQSDSHHPQNLIHSEQAEPDSPTLDTVRDVQSR